MRTNQNIKNEVFELTITGLSHDGRGIARLDDKVVFVHGALPSEVVKAKMNYVSSRFNAAQAMEVLVASSERIQPECDFFGLCGGCQWQHVSQKQQIRNKQLLLDEQLTQAKISPRKWLDPLYDTAFGYRQKARLAVKYVEKKDTVLVGFREQKSNKIAIIESCKVLHPEVGLRIKDLRDCISSLEAKAHIAQIEVAVGDNEVALVFRNLTPLSVSDKDKLITFCKANRFSCYLQPDSYESVHCIWPENKPFDLTYRLADQNLTFHFHPSDFTQVNMKMNQKMINQAIRLLAPKPTDVILDLFCGLGNFSLAMAQHAKQVVGVEGTQKMCERAARNAEFNNLHNAQFHYFDLTQAFERESWAHHPYTALILDPPRCGAQEVVNSINQFNVDRILYISCNPATFVRDAAILQNQHGYQLEQVGIMDMFTHTAHVETMGLFVRTVSKTLLEPI